VHISRNQRKTGNYIFCGFIGKQGVNLACCTQKLQLQHHFSETRHPHRQNDTIFNLLYLRLGYRQNFLGLATASHAVGGSGSTKN